MSLKPRVLVVDDEIDVLDLADYRLRREGYDVIRAANGSEALSRARCDGPDVIVLDMLLPDLDGQCVGELLSVQPSTRDIPVVVFSSLDKPVFGLRRGKQKYFAWVKKGTDFRFLKDCIREALNEGLVRLNQRNKRR